jgi:hypothetical protein
MVLLDDVLKAISDEKSLSLFKTIAISKGNSDILVTKLKLTRKQYYSRLEVLTKANLITRIKGIYSLTSFGKVIYNLQEKLNIATEYYWKLKALDLILMYGSSKADAKLAQEEQIRLVDSIIDNREIKDIILGTSTAAAATSTTNTSIITKERQSYGPTTMIAP